MLIEGFEVEVNEDMWEEELKDQGELVTQLMELSFYSFLGIESPTTHKLKGRVGKTEFVVLIDNGATHNFVSPQLVQRDHLE